MILSSTVAFQLFCALTPRDQVKFEKFLTSPYFNHREDVCKILALFRRTDLETLERMNKRAFFEQLFPNQPFEHLALNYALNFFAERLEQFLACEELLGDAFQNDFMRCRAFRKRGLGRHFERNSRILSRKMREKSLRNAEFWLQSYQLEGEVFAHQMMSSREAPANLSALRYALDQFVTLENLRWSSTEYALSALTKEPVRHSPFATVALEWAEAGAEPASLLLKRSFEVLRDSNDLTAFEDLKSMIGQSADLFSPSEARDIYMSAINFCIRKHNQGEKQYTREALDLYKEALERNILLENGVLPKYTYGNINNLSHLVGEIQWAREFLEQYQPFLPASDRDEVYRYNIAIHHFRRSEYALSLELLRDIEFTEVFVNLDIRKMLVRSYFELKEWQALHSLLESFHAYLRRLKKIGYHRDSYLNFIKFTYKVEKAMRADKSKRNALAKKIIDTKYVAEREWLLSKLG